MKKVFLAMMAVALMVSCKSTQSTSQNTTAKQKGASELFIETNQWELTAFQGQTPEEAGFKRKLPLMIINMAEQKVGGNSGCNSFGGEVIIEGDTVTFDKVFSTKMYCDGVPEHEFFQLLQQPLKYTLKGDVLQFEKEGVTLMVFKLKQASEE
ncbi:META domain-containing protein [Carboxylicivirga taeanensis]|uniref:META domain-containing protein n=1 Tax=Carboxylicivirga taeanensis TaxID=1416875 RepID=UPI003F6DB857